MSKQKYGFVYIWRDKKHNRYYIGCHWGFEDDGYICSSPWMKQAYLHRPHDFKRRILKTNIEKRPDMFIEEQRYLNMIKQEEIKVRYYNLKISSNETWHKYDERLKTVGEKISAAKKGKKTGPRDPSIGAKISASKKGTVFTEEHKQKLREAKIGTKHTEEWKKQNSERVKQQWADGIRKPREAKAKLPSRKPGERMKELWADPVWAENQRQKLKAAKKIYNLSTEE